MNKKSLKRFASYPRLNPRGLGKNISVADLIDQTLLAYNGGRLREAARLLTEKMLPENGLVGMSVTGALTPAGLGKSCLIPLIRAGFVSHLRYSFRLSCVAGYGCLCAQGHSGAGISATDGHR
jgi:deoxyhypusine synthase